MTDLEISVRTVPPRRIAAVRRRVPVREIATTWRGALDQVWAFLRRHPGLRTDGHNVFLYHHPANRESPMDIDFGVEVTRSFERSGEVYATETGAGRVAAALHVGPYDWIGATHAAIQGWVAANGVSLAGTSWEIYGDPADDPAKSTTVIEYLLS